MFREVKKIQKGVLRITSANERWYTTVRTDLKTGKKEYTYFPSSTWISSYYPKGVYFHKWLAGKGWSEIETIKQSAADKGSRVHYACYDLDKGKEIKINDKYLNPSTGQQEELTKEEVDCIISYRDFLDEMKPVLLAQEVTSFGDVYAGTADKIFVLPSQLLLDKNGKSRINGKRSKSWEGERQIWIVDLKTSQSIWPEHELQISS